MLSVGQFPKDTFVTRPGLISSELEAEGVALQKGVLSAGMNSDGVDLFQA